MLPPSKPRSGFRSSGWLVCVLGALALGACTSSNDSASSSYCSAFSDYVNRCGITDACTQAEVKACSSLANIYSPAAVNAQASCAQNIQCGDAGDAAVSTCIQQAYAKLTPSSSQQKLAQDYCAACPGTMTSADCASGFYGSSGLGSTLLPFSDTVMQKMDGNCISGSDAGALQCELTFFQCAEVQLEAVAPTPAACQASNGSPDGG
ncbi:MAG TPA: hypothetical protein VGI39_21535 [Polyangiaceae bacterium]|jgi:hypothetical protein